MKFRRCAFEQFAHITVAAVALLTVGCQSKPQTQPPTAEEQKKIEQDYQKTMEQQKQLTSGYDKSMQATPPSTGYIPTKQNTGKQQKANQQPQKQSSQQTSQQPPPQSQPKQ